MTCVYANSCAAMTNFVWTGLQLWVFTLSHNGCPISSASDGYGRWWKGSLFLLPRAHERERENTQMYDRHVGPARGRRDKRLSPQPRAPIVDQAEEATSLHRQLRDLATATFSLCFLPVVILSLNFCVVDLATPSDFTHTSSQQFLLSSFL